MAIYVCKPTSISTALVNGHSLIELFKHSLHSQANERTRVTKHSLRGFTFNSNMLLVSKWTVLKQAHAIYNSSYQKETFDTYVYNYLNQLHVPFNLPSLYVWSPGILSGGTLPCRWLVLSQATAVSVSLRMICIPHVSTSKLHEPGRSTGLVMLD